MNFSIFIAVLLAVALTVFFGFRNRTISPPVGSVPTDADVIEQLRLAGSDLSKPHQVEFYLYFPTEAIADRVATKLVERGYETDVRLGKGTTQYLLLATKPLVLSAPELVRIGKEFEALVSMGGGEYDGWGASVVR